MKRFLLSLSVACFFVVQSTAQPCKQFILSINGQSNGSEVVLQDLAKADSLVFENTPCNQRLRIYTFSVFVNERQYETYGNKFTKEMKAAFRKLRVGDTIYFEKVKTRDRSNPEQMRMISNQSILVIEAG